MDVADLSACLPPAKVLELVRLNQELEMAVHEAHAANAAVAAVAQVLASKQAAALRSREVASAATKRLRRFMAELDTQVGAGYCCRPAAAGLLWLLLVLLLLLLDTTVPLGWYGVQ